MTVTGGGKARFTQRFIDEAGKIMAERALVTVLSALISGLSIVCTG